LRYDKIKGNKNPKEKMQPIRGTVKNGVIHPLESLNSLEGQSVLITVIQENQERIPTQKLSELLLLPELENDDLLLSRDRDTGREIIL
jgi:predicted DNA-binding antitoxin AbrB/MazE fold protein